MPQIREGEDSIPKESKNNERLIIERDKELQSLCRAVTSRSD